MKAAIKGREFDIEFAPATQGFSMQVMEYTGGRWNVLADYDNTQFILSTHFEALCDLSSDLFEEAVHGESLAEQLNVEIRFWDDIQCAICEGWRHYQEMKETKKGAVCEYCQEQEEN